MAQKKTNRKKNENPENETLHDKESNDSGENGDISLNMIGIRLLYTLLFLIIFAIVETIIQLIVLFQFIHLFFARKPNQPVQDLSNKISTYAYKLLRYVTMNEEQHPFPFSDWPDPLDPPATR